MDRDVTATIIHQANLPTGERSARSLLPAAHALLADVGWRPADVQLIAIASGPGSFTGLRIGVVAAKTLAYALKTQLVAVHTLAAMAQAARTAGAEGRLWTILDAQRQELFAASFAFGEELADQPAPNTQVVPVGEWVAQLSPGDSVSGPPLAALGQQIPAGVKMVDEALWQPAASSVGLLAAGLAARGYSIDPMTLVPNYYRLSAAEEKAATT